MSATRLRDAVRSCPFAVAASCLALLGTGAAGIRLSPGLWFDEAYSVAFASQSWGAIVEGIRAQEVNNAAYYLLLHLWLQVSGELWWVRGLSVVLAVATSLAIARTASLARRPAVVRWSVLAFAAFWGTWIFTMEARGSMLAALLATLLVGTHVRGLADGASRRRRAMVAVWAVLLVATAVLGLLLVAALAAQAAWRRRLLVPYAVALGGGAGVWLLAHAADTGQVWWIQPTSWSSLQLALLYLLGTGASAFLYVVLAGVFAWRYARGRLDTAPEPEARSLATAVGLWALGTPLLIIAFSLVRPIVVGRYFFFCLPALALLVGLVAAASPLLGRLVPVVLVAGMVLAPYGRPAYWHRQENLTGAAELMAAQARPGDAVDYVNTEIRPAMAHYLAATPAGAGLDDLTLLPGAAPWSTGGAMDRDVVASDYLARLDADTGRLWVVYRAGYLSGDPLLDLARAAALGDRPMLEQHHYGYLEVRLYGPPTASAIR